MNFCQSKTTYFLESEKKDIIDLRPSSNHPLIYKYSEIYQGVVLSGSIEHGRSQPGFSLLGNSPFVLSAKNGLEVGVNSPKFERKILETFDKYYENFQPKSAAEMLGLNFDSNHKLSKLPPWAAIFPWRARTVESYKQTYERAAILENEVYGFEGGIELGWLFCGPVSDVKKSIDSKRMKFVLEQIIDKGYIRTNEKDGDVKATALVNQSGEWRWLITAGNHRASAAAALGYHEIPIRVNLVISRDDVKYWPQVIEGLFKKEEALKVFDAYFNGTPLNKSAQIWNQGD